MQSWYNILLLHRTSCLDCCVYISAWQSITKQMKKGIETDRKGWWQIKKKTRGNLTCHLRCPLNPSPFAYVRWAMRILSGWTFAFFKASAFRNFSLTVFTRLLSSNNLMRAKQVVKAYFKNGAHYNVRRWKEYEAQSKENFVIHDERNSFCFTTKPQ